MRFPRGSREDESGHTRVLPLVLNVRDDDPKLTAHGRTGASVTALAGSLAPVTTDPVAGDGLQRWTFAGEPPAGGNARRSLRARFALAP